MEILYRSIQYNSIDKALKGEKRRCPKLSIFEIERKFLFFRGFCVFAVIGCVNLDVVGCFDQVYLDTMNFFSARSLTNCKQGMMPFSDAYVFARNGIPSVCFSSGPAATDFKNGIWQICSTLHNNRNDNNLGLLNFSMIQNVSNEVKKAVKLMAA